MRSLLVDVEKGIIAEVEPDGLDDYYELIRCRCVDIVKRNIGGREFDIICDDEGTFVESPRVSAVDQNGNPELVGNLIISGLARRGELTDLSDDDISLIRSCFGWVRTLYHPKGNPVLIIS